MDSFNMQKAQILWKEFGETCYVPNRHKIAKFTLSKLIPDKSIDN